MRARLVALVALAACGAQDGGPVNPDAPNPPGDAPPGCYASISFDPTDPVAGDGQTVRAVANVFGAPGVLTYQWSLTLDGNAYPFEQAAADDSMIQFPSTGSGLALQAGLYHARLDLLNSGCATAQADVNVTAPGANTQALRLHVVPPAAAGVPPLEKNVLVHGGGNATVGVVALDPGIAASPRVTGIAGAGIAAYVRFAPLGAPGATVEAFADASGNVTARILNQDHAVLVVPSVPGVAPKRFASWSATSTTLALGAGTTLTGTVRDGANAALAGAHVQLFLDGVPSTLTTTDAAGAFAVHAELAAGAQVTVDVTPPDGSPLPRLAATAAFPFDASTPIAVRYTALGTRAVGGITVRRGGAPVAGASVSIVGTLAGAGTVTVGATSAAAIGTVRIAATTSGSGALSSVSAPAADLSAVVAAGPGDLAVADLDLTAGSPSTLDAPAMVSAPSLALDANGQALGGATVDAVPVGALALANAPALQVRADAAGAFALTLAAGGHYDLRFRDPAGRGAPLVVADRTAATVDAIYHLAQPVRVSGSLTLNGNPAATAGSTVQMLCDSCAGVERSRPIAEAAVGATGAFSLAVPDPGTM